MHQAVEYFAPLGQEFGPHPYGTFVTFGDNGTNYTIDATTPRGFVYGWEYYGTFTRALFTLFQVMTGESWSEVVARPLMFGLYKDAVFVSVFFVSFILLMQIVLTNVVVAVRALTAACSSALRSASAFTVQNFTLVAVVLSQVLLDKFVEDDSDGNGGDAPGGRKSLDIHAMIADAENDDVPPGSDVAPPPKTTPPTVEHAAPRDLVAASVESKAPPRVGTPVSKALGFSYTVVFDAGPGPLGLGVETDKRGHVVVSDVAPSSAAGRKGVLLGSRIVAINDHPCEHLAQDEVTRLLIQRKERRVEFVTTRTGATSPALGSASGWSDTARSQALTASPGRPGTPAEALMQMGLDDKLTLLLRQMSSLQQAVERCESGLKRCEDGLGELRQGASPTKNWFTA